MDTVIDVKELREQLGLTQSAFAAEVGVDQGTVSNWENRKTEPRGAARKLMELMLVRAPRSLQPVEAQS